MSTLVDRAPVLRSIAVVAAGALLSSGCTGGRTPDGAPPSAPDLAGPVVAEADLPPYTEPDGEGGVRLVESGMSLLVTDDGQEWVGYGFVVENTSELVATDTEVRVDVVDDAGEPLWVWRREQLDRIRVLLPGQRFGAGELIELVQLTSGVAPEPSAIEITIGGSLWYPPDTPMAEFASVTATGVTTDCSEVQAGDNVTVRFRLDSSYRRSIELDVGTVFRDGAGAIIGGHYSSDSWTEIVAAPGTSSQEERLRDTQGCPVPVDVDRGDVVAEVHANPIWIADSEETAD